MNGFKKARVKAGRSIRKLEMWTEVGIGVKWSDLSYILDIPLVGLINFFGYWLSNYLVSNYW